MILYDFLCKDRHRSSGALESMFDDNPECTQCGSPTGRVPASPRLVGRADPGPSREEMPHSWRGIHGGDPDAVAHWRNKITKREKLEEKYPEIAGDRRPVLAHEGMFASNPLRAGDDVATAVSQAQASETGRSHTHKPVSAPGQREN